MPPVMEAPVREPESPENAPSTDVAELHLLISEMDDELTRYRWREAVWISLVVHVLFFASLIFVPKWFPKGAVIIPVTATNKDATFLLEPPDRQRVKPPKTEIQSDKNRIAQSTKPVLDKELLRKLREAGRPNPPAPQPAAQPPAPPQQAAQQAPPQPQVGQQSASPPAPQQPRQTAQLRTPPANSDPSPFKTSGGSVVQHAIDSLSANHGATRYSFGGDYGANGRADTNMRGNVEITSDTMGVDFGPYLERVLWRIKMNWYNLIPEVARPPLMKKGSLIIAFAITKEGQVAGMVLQLPSGDVYLDRAAWGGITASNPFEPLPAQFAGTYLGLRIKFIYNTSIDEAN